MSAPPKKVLREVRIAIIRKTKRLHDHLSIRRIIAVARIVVRPEHGSIRLEMCTSGVAGGSKERNTAKLGLFNLGTAEVKVRFRMWKLRARAAMGAAHSTGDEMRCKPDTSWLGRCLASNKTYMCVASEENRCGRIQCFSCATSD